MVLLADESVSLKTFRFQLLNPLTPEPQNVCQDYFEYFDYEAVKKMSKE